MPKNHREPTKKARWNSITESKTIKSKNSVELFYQVIGSGQTTVVLANGLGGRLFSWAPLLDNFSHKVKFICWDYRGLFCSTSPGNPSDLSIFRHAQDIKTILDEENIKQAVICGWSMGVQVTLEFASQYPEMTEKLILLNGTHGHTFETALQPIFRVPWLPKLFHELIELSLDYRWIRKGLCFFPRQNLTQKVAGQFLKRFLKNEDMPDLIAEYFNDVFRETNFPNYLRLLQELDAHSAFHHLRDITAPVLIISGGTDLLTPDYQSREMNRKLKNAKHYSYALGNHFILLERADDIIPKISKFLFGE